jgi:putative oxidoreductase
MSTLVPKLEKAYALELALLRHAQAPLLLAIRLYWGWQFFQTGSGKLANVERTTAFFASLGMPAPQLNVYAAGLTEAIGGLLLLAGLGSRVVPFALIGTMLVAYGTAHRDAVGHIFSNPDDFVTAAPFLFLYASVLVVVFGAGTFSADHAIGLWWKKKTAATAGAPGAPARVELLHRVC